MATSSFFPIRLFLIPSKDEIPQLLETDGPPYGGQEWLEQDEKRRVLQKKVEELTGCLIQADDNRQPGGGYAWGFPELPGFVADILLAVASSGVTAVLIQLIRTWVDSKNGRKLKVVIEDIEIEATQMKTEEFLKLIERVQDIRDKNQIRSLLVNSVTK